MTEQMNLPPRCNSFLLGQTDAEDIFLRAWQNDTLHHAYILHGIPGIGKATLAFRMARFLLWADKNNKDNIKSLNVPENSDIFKQVATGSHPDLLVVERDYIENDRRKIISAIRKGEALDDEELSSLKKSAFIRVDDIRKINEFLAKTSFNDGWRVVIIDCADDMNKNAANALLKILEEPPAKTVLFLISHNIGTLLPTIQSRCAKLPCRHLQDTEVASLLRRYRPELSETMIDKLTVLSRESIGKAVLYADTDAVKIYDKLCELLYAKSAMKTADLLDFCSEMAADAEKFMICQSLLLRFLQENMPSAQDKEAVYTCWNDAQRMFSDCVNINMDKRMMLINLLTSTAKVL